MMERYTICLVFLLRILGGTRALFQTTLNPPPPTLEVCPDENYTLSCTESATPRILWNWNDVTMRDYIAGLDNDKTNTTDLLLSDNNMVVSTRLLSINSSHVHSQLEFTLFENVTLVNVWCNRVMITIQSGVKPKLNIFFITNFISLETRASLILQFTNSTLSPTNITLSSKLGTININNRIINVPLTIYYMEDYTITFRTEDCGEKFYVEGNISILNCSMDQKFVISLDINDTSYKHTCTEHVLNSTSCIKVTSSEMNCSSDIYHFDNSTTTGTSDIATEKNIRATNYLIILPVVFIFSLVLFILSVILFTMTFVVIKNRNTRAKERSNNLTKCVTTPQHPSTPTYEEVKVDRHSEATEMTANSAYGLQHTQLY